MNNKYKELCCYLESLGSAAAAFSGGVDSTFLLKAAKDALGDKVTAVTVRSQLITQSEIDEAAEFCDSENIRHIIYDFNPLEIDGFADNPANRCYICKKEIFGIINKAAAELGANAVIEGSNLDDDSDYRPGIKAIRELGVLSPLQTVGLTKAEIREISKALGLPTWDKPSLACLASRFAYGDKITAERLRRIGDAESILFSAGFKQARVRIHGDIARIEVAPENFKKLLELREKIYREFNALGFSYITMDLKGYRTGSMNEQL